MAIPLTFLDAAAKVLAELSRPMSAAEIIHEARARGLLETSGKTPTKTLNARISEDILHNKASSRFMRSDGGRFALRNWSGIQERIAPRRRIALVDEQILAFDAAQLRTFVPHDGLNRDENAHSAILASAFSVKRSLAEERFDIIQLVSVYVVRHTHRYLTYKRSKRLPEGRLHHAYSCFFGGHLNEDDLAPLFRFSDPETALHLLDRELSEELRLASAPRRMTFKGLLYDPRSEVSKQHVGVVFLVDSGTDQFQIGERGFLTDAKFETFAELSARLGDFENWSQYLIEKEIRLWN